MGGKNKKVTIGYRYYIGAHMVLCQGHIDHIKRIRVDKRTAWDDGRGEDSAIQVDAEELFGGDEREGGVSGVVSIQTGEPGQQTNSYLAELFSGTSTALGGLPTYRGVSAVVLEQCYMGNNPYLKPWSFTTQRILKKYDGQEQWYVDKAPIGYFDGVGKFAVYITIDWSDSMSDLASNGLSKRQNVRNSLGELLDWMVEQKSLSSNIDFDVGICLWGGSTGGGAELRYFDQEFSLTQAKANALKSFLNTSTTITHTYYPASYIEAPDFYNTAASDRQRISFFISDGDPYFNPGYTDESGKFELASMTFDGLSPLGPGSSPAIYGFGIGLTDARYYFSIFGRKDNGQRNWDDVESDEMAQYLQSKFFSHYDMNPAHIIRECLTDPDWGLGYSDNDIDSEAFTYAADVLYQEFLGLSFLWTQEMKIEEFVSEVLRHIDAALYVDRRTGKFVLKLIRDDNSETDMIVLDEDDNLLSLKKAKRTPVTELTSSLTINYHSATTDETGSYTIHNQALVKIQGTPTHTTITYPGITNLRNAIRVANRDMRALSTPLLKCELEANRDADALNIGDAFILNKPTAGINNLVMRVEAISFGDGRKNTIKINAVEDVFSTPAPYEDISNAEQDTLWFDPAEAAPVAASPRLVTETPYYEIVTTLGVPQANGLLALDNDVGLVMTAAGRQGSEVSAVVNYDDGAGYITEAALDFCPYGYLSQPVTESDTSFFITGGKDLSLVEDGSVAQIGDELVRVDSLEIDSSGQWVATVGRGVMDTVPAVHNLTSAGSDAILFWDFSYTLNQGSLYTAGDDINVKIRTIGGAQTLLLDDAPVDTVEMASRAFRPYPPGNLQIDSASYPGYDSNSTVEFDLTNTISWAHRDRLQQTDAFLYDYTYGNIGPEDGTTYVVRVEGLDSSLSSLGNIVSENVGNVTSYTFGSNTEVENVSALENADYVRISVLSRRDGYDSWQAASTVIRNATVFDSNSLLTRKVLFETIELTSAGEFDFSSIPAGYNRIVIEGIVRCALVGSGDTVDIKVYLNSDTTDANYHSQQMGGRDGSPVNSEYAAPRLIRVPAISSPTGAYANVRIEIEGYAEGHRKIISGWTSYNKDTGEAEAMRSTVVSSISAIVSRVRIQSDTSPADELIGVLSIYGEN